MFETARTHARRRRRPADRGILLIFGLITPEPPTLVMYILCQCIYYDEYNKADIPEFRASVVSFLRIMSLYCHFI